MEVVVNDSLGTNRHGSISEQTRELDELLDRSSVISVLTDSQILYHDEYERIVGGSCEDLEGGNRRAATVRGNGREKRRAVENENTCFETGIIINK